VPVRFLSDAQREQLSGFPAELDDEALDRFFTLSGAEVTEARQRRGEGNRLGWSLLLCGLRMLGFCPDDVTTAPAVAVRFVARQLGVDPEVLTGYGKRAQTRTDHVNQVKAFLGFRSPTAADLGEVGDWLAAEALVQDRPVVLFRLVCARLQRVAPRYGGNLPSETYWLVSDLLAGDQRLWRCDLAHPNAYRRPTHDQDKPFPDTPH
jgi:Domain of unknown function (DUF4158)